MHDVPITAFGDVDGHHLPIVAATSDGILG
jgi:hypothetical protein